MFKNVDTDFRNTHRLLKAHQVAMRLNISRSYVYQLIKDGDIPSVRIRGAFRVRPEDLEAYIERNMHGKQG